MKKKLSVLFAALLVTTLMGAHGIIDSLNGVVYQGIYILEDATLGDGTPAIIVQYVGAEENGQVDGNATGDVLLLDGALGAEAAIDTASNCGAVAGTLDVSDADCDTFGELVQECNSLDDWNCALVGVLPNQDAGASALQMLDLGTATNCKTPAGVPIYTDTSATDNLTIPVIPGGGAYLHTDMRTYARYNNAEDVQLIAPEGLWNGVVSCVAYASTLFDDGDADTTNFHVLALNMDGIEDYEGFGGKTPYTLFLKDQGTDDTAYNEDFSRVPICAPPGHRIWVQLDGAALGTGASSINAVVVTGKR